MRWPAKTAPVSSPTCEGTITTYSLTRANLRLPARPRQASPTVGRATRGRQSAAVAIGFAAMALNACRPLGNDTSGGGSKRSPLTRARSATVTVLNHSNGKTYQSSGVVYDTSLGRVLTSATAVWDRDSLEVVTRDGRKVPARLVARSPCGDLAVLILDPK